MKPMKSSKVTQLLERYGYTQDAEPADDGIRYWRRSRYGLPVSVVNSIWEVASDGSRVQRGTGSKLGLRRLELAILRSEKKP
jgi:hypothetical protein